MQLLVDVDERRRDRARPRRTEKHSPWAWRGPWYGSWPRISTRVVGVRREVERGEHLVVRRVDRVALALGGGRTPAARASTAWSNSPRSTGFQSVVIGRHLGASARLASSVHPPYHRRVSSAATAPSTASLTVPRSRLATLPTPLERGPGLPGGARLWVKRDDLTGLGAGGNKARKLEFLCGEALRAGARSLVTVGAGQSNHCRMTAAAGAVLGLEVHLVLSGTRPARPTGNQLLAELFGAQLHYVGCPPHHWGELEIAREQLTDELAAAGAAPHSIPIGGSTPTGALGYVAAYVELVEQCRALGMRAGRRRAHVVERRHPRRARRRAGAAAGARPRRPARRARRSAWPRASTLGVPDVRAAGRRDAGARRRPTPRSTDDDVEIDDRWLGADYGVPTAAGDEAIRWAAVHGGWVLDRTYTGKGFAGLLGNAATGRWRPGAEVVFVHTGGLPAVFADGGAPG